MTNQFQIITKTISIMGEPKLNKWSDYDDSYKAPFHDAVMDALDGGQLTDEQLSVIFESLPFSIRSIANEWGLGDTVFRDEAYSHLKQFKTLEEFASEASNSKLPDDAPYIPAKAILIEPNIKEATIVINGVTLTFAQSLTVRVAMNNFIFDVSSIDGLSKLYLQHTQDVLELIHRECE